MIKPYISPKDGGWLGMQHFHGSDPDQGVYCWVPRESMERVGWSDEECIREIEQAIEDGVAQHFGVCPYDRRIAELIGWHPGWTLPPA